MNVINNVQIIGDIVNNLRCANSRRTQIRGNRITRITPPSGVSIFVSRTHPGIVLYTFRKRFSVDQSGRKRRKAFTIAISIGNPHSIISNSGTVYCRRPGINYCGSDPRTTIRNRHSHCRCRCIHPHVSARRAPIPGIIPCPYSDRIKFIILNG